MSVVRKFVAIVLTSGPNELGLVQGDSAQRERSANDAYNLLVC